MDNKEAIENIKKAKQMLQEIKEYQAVPNIATEKVRVKVLDSDATIPTRNNLSDAGWDLYALRDYTIAPSDREIIKTGISLQIPDEWVGLIWPRSGMSVKKGADVLAGVIDSGYRGEIMVCIYNTNGPNLENDAWPEKEILIKKGDRIAQILFQKVPDVELVVVDELSESDRGKRGIGSSGD